MKNLHILEKEDIKNAVLKMALPMVASQIVSVIYNMADRYFVSNYVGQAAFAGVGAGFPVLILTFALINLFLTGAPILYGRALGEKDFEKASKIKHGIIIPSAIIIIVISLTVAYFLKPILFSMGATQNTINHAYDYYIVIISFLVVSYLNFNVAGFIRSEGAITYAMIVVMVGAVINIFADYIFIVNFKMGTRGAAYATILSQVIGTLIGYIHQLRSKIVKFNILKTLNIDYKILMSSIKLSTSSFFTPLMNSIFAMSINNIFATFIKSQDVLDSYMLVWSLIFMARSFVIQPIIGLSISGGPLISFNYGAKNKQRVIGTFFWTITYGLILLLPFWIIFTLKSDLLIKIFNISQENYPLAKLGMNVSYVFLPGLVLNFLLSPLIQSLGRTRSSTVMSILGICITIPVAYIIAWKFGIEYIWYCQTILSGLNVIIAIVILLNIFKGKKFHTHFD